MINWNGSSVWLTCFPNCGNSLWFVSFLNITGLTMNHILSMYVFFLLISIWKTLIEMNISNKLWVHSNSLNRSILRDQLFMNWTFTYNHIFSLDVILIDPLMLVFLYPHIIFTTCILLVFYIPLWCPLVHGVTSILQLIFFLQFLSRPSPWLYFDMCIHLSHNLLWMLGRNSDLLGSKILHAWLWDQCSEIPPNKLSLRGEPENFSLSWCLLFFSFMSHVFIVE